MVLQNGNLIRIGGGEKRVAKSFYAAESCGFYSQCPRLSVRVNGFGIQHLLDNNVMGEFDRKEKNSVLNM